MWKHCLCLFFAKIDGNALTQQINRDSNDLISFILTSTISTIGLIIQLILISAILYIIHPVILLISFIIAILYTVLYLFSQKALFQTGFNFEESFTRYFTSLADRLTKIRMSKTHVLSDYFREQNTGAYNELLNFVLQKQHCVSKFTLISNNIFVISFWLVVLTSIWLISQNSIQPSLILVVIDYFSSYCDISKYILSILSDYQNACVHLSRIDALIIEKSPQEGRELLHNICNIQLGNLSFGYSASEEPLLKNINHTFKLGSINVIAGNNGAGKSTLLDLIAGLYPGEYKGEIYFDTLPMSQLSMTQLRKQFLAVTEQKPELLKGNLLLNITAFSSSYNKSEIESYIKRLNLERLWQIDSLDNPEVANLSGGEKQKVALLRSILQHPKVMLLDEPTSALDQLSKSEVYKIIDELKEQTLIVIVTHDQKLIDLSGNVLNL